MKTLSKLFSTLFYVGFIPYAPGTIASAFTVVFWYIFINIFTTYVFFIFILLLTALSFYLVNIYTNDQSSSDPSDVVIDEFICFRIFDIYKIYPVNLGEKINGSVGVIADDIIAGIYTVIFLMIYKIIIY